MRAAAVLSILSAALMAPFPSFDAHVIGQAGNQMGATSLVDVDHDGDLDWVVGERKNVWWFEYQGPDKWVHHTIGTNCLTDVGGTAFDVDGDGWMDQVTAGAWFRNPRSPRTRPWDRFEVGGITNSHDCVAADVDGDGKQDLVAISDRSGVHWYKIPADPTQKWTGTKVGAGVHGGIGPRGVGDLDGDGDADIVRSTGWFENTGKGEGWTWHENLTGGGHPGKFPDCTKSWITDLDKDGDNDIGMVDADVFTFDARVHWFENADGKGLTWKEHVIATGKGDLHTLALADFDSDGDLDVFSGEGPGGGTGEKGARRWFIWENVDGKGGSWKEHMIRENAAECHEGVAADVDRDGAIDLCSKPWNGNLHVFLKNRAGGPR